MKDTDFFSFLDRMDNANFLNENYILENGIGEDRESKNMSKARKVVTNLGLEDDPMDYITDIRNKIPNSRLNDCMFLPGVTRMVAQGNLFNNRTACANINTALRLINAAHLSEYNGDLNGMTGIDLIKRFEPLAKQDLIQRQKELNSKSFQKDKSYKIVKIPDFETASKYSQYTSWCITTYKDMYEEYTHGRTGIFYFILKDGFEKMKPIQGENCPLDDYGLSMIAVSIDADGSLNTCTCRWNHDNGGNDNIMTDNELSNLIGQNIYKVCKPKKVKVTCDTNNYKIFIADNEPILYDKKDDSYQQFYDGYSIIYYVGGENFVNPNGKILSNEWFSWCDNFCNGVAVVKKGDKYNYLTVNGDLLSNKWFDNCKRFEDPNFGYIRDNGKLGAILRNGQLILPN